MTQPDVALPLPVTVHCLRPTKAAHEVSEDQPSADSETFSAASWLLDHQQHREQFVSPSTPEAQAVVLPLPIYPDRSGSKILVLSVVVVLAIAIPVLLLTWLLL